MQEHHPCWSTFHNGSCGYGLFVCCLKEYWACFYGCRSKDGKERTTAKQNAVKWVLFVARSLDVTKIVVVAKISGQNKSIWHFFLVHWTEKPKNWCIFVSINIAWYGWEGRVCVVGEGTGRAGWLWQGRVVVMLMIANEIALIIFVENNVLVISRRWWKKISNRWCGILWFISWPPYSHSFTGLFENTTWENHRS